MATYLQVRGSLKGNKKRWPQSKAADATHDAEETESGPAPSVDWRKAARLREAFDLQLLESEADHQIKEV